jgi:hypothetical protein
MAIVRNFKTTYGTTYLAQDEGVLTQYSKGEEHVKGFCPKHGGGGGGGGVKLLRFRARYVT